MDDLAVMHIILEKVAVARLVGREIGVVCGRNKKGWCKGENLVSRLEKRLTLEYTNHINKHIVS